MDNQNYQQQPPPPPQGYPPPPPPQYPQQGYPPPPPQGYPPPPPPQKPGSWPGKGMSIAAMVLGICSLVVPYAGVATAIVGLILGIMGKKKAVEVGAPTGMATAGIVLSIIGLAGAILVVIACVSCLGALGSIGAFDPMYW